jgi:hypothetical protein
VPGLVAGSRTDTAHDCKPLHRLLVQKALHHELSRLVHVRVDDVGRERRRLGGGLHADVAAHLSHPDRQPFAAERCQPEPDVIALGDVQAPTLQRDVLLAPERVQRTHRRLEHFTVRDGRADHAANAVDGDCFGEIPAARRHGREHVRAIPDDDDVERVALAGTVGLGRAAWQFANSHPCLVQRQVRKRVHLVVELTQRRKHVIESLGRQQHGEAHPERMPRRRDPDLYESPSAPVARVDVAFVDAVAAEKEGHRMPAKCFPDALRALVVELPGRSQRRLVSREIVGIDCDRQEPVRHVSLIHDPDPDRLHALFGQRHAEQLRNLLFRRYGELHRHAILGDGLDAAGVDDGSARRGGNDRLARAP